MTTIEYKAYAPTDAGAQTTNTLSASAVAYTRVLDSPNESRLAAVKPPGLDDVHSPCSRPSTQISRVDTRRQLEHASRVTKDACYFPKRQHISAAVRVVASCYNWASCKRRAPTCRGVCPDAVVLYRHRHSPVQTSFLNNVSRVQLFVFLSFWAASPCASNGLNFAYLGHYTEIQCIWRSRTIILTTYRRAEPCKVRVRSTFREDPWTVGTVTRCGFLHVTRNKAESVTRARCAAATSRRRVKQPYHRRKYAVGCTRGRSHLPGAGKSRTQLAFLRAPLASFPDLFICCTARKTVRSRAKPEREGHRPRSYHWVSAPPFVTTADNPAKLPLQSLSWLDCGAVPQRRTCTSLLRSPCAHRENATSLRAAAGLACRLGRDRFLKLACRKADNGLSLVTSDFFSRALRSEPPAPQVKSKPRAAASTHSNAEFSCFSPNVGTHPCGGVPCSGSPPDLAAGKARQSPSGSEFQRGADAAWNVCAESEWKTYSREELLSDSDKSGISSEKQEKGVTNRVLYNVQRFPVDVLSSSPTSGRLRAEQARGREAHLERLAAEKAAAGDGGVGVSQGKREQKRLRTLTWRDYVSWLPPPQPQYNLAQPSRHERTFQEGRKSEVGADQADLVRSLGSTKEHTYDEWKGFPPSASTPIDDLPLESLIWGNETILYRQAFKEAPMIVDEETFRRLKSCWTDAELKRVQREEKDVYGIPEDVPDDCWIPISPHLSEGRLVQEYGLLPNITLTAGGYDYIETYYDPARNYTWSYKRWNPLKQDGEPPRNLEAEARSIYELETEKSRRYWHEEAHPPPLKPDDGIFRQATIADEMTKGMKRTPLGMDQWHYSPTHPLGQAAELQNFWLTALKRTLPEARARVAAEATAALAAVSAEAVLSKDELRSSPATSGLTSEKGRTISLPLWIRVPVAGDGFAVDSNVAFRRVSSQALAASESSPALQPQPDVEVTPHLRRTRRAVLVKSGLRSGGAAAGELTDPKEQEPQRAHAANTSRERRKSARGTDTALREALRGRCTPKGSSRTDVDGSGGMTTPTAKSASGAEFTHGSVARIFPIQRSAYQPLAFSDAENGDAGTTGSADDMKYRRLGKSDLFVSEVGLGTMTVGRPPLDGNRTKQLLTYAVDVWGVNFIDTAELYPLPAAPQTYGTAEEIIGDWLRSTGRRSGGRREKLIIATKVAGPSSKLAWLRSSCDSCVYPREKLYAQQEPQEPAGRRQPDADRVFFTSRARGAAECARGSWTEGRRWGHSYERIPNVERGAASTFKKVPNSSTPVTEKTGVNFYAVDADAEVPLHWPDRYVPMQASGDAAEVLYDPEEARFQQATRDGVGMEEQLDAIKELLRRGKIRAWGLSNETPYGVCRFTRLATKIGLPPPASVQLQYNLLCRNDVEKGFVELARPQNAGTGLLAYGALAGGVLTGKYLEWLEKPTTGRMLRFPSYMKRYRGSLAARAVSAYYYLALRLGHPNLTVMALRWVLTRPFICSTLLGFTDYYQLRENLYCTHPVCGIISDWTEREINFLHWKWRDPIRTIQ